MLKMKHSDLKIVVNKILKAIGKQPEKISMKDFKKLEQVSGKDYSGVLSYYRKMYSQRLSTTSKNRLLKDLYCLNY